MHFTCMGISHNTCQVDIREKYYLHPTDKDMLLDELRACPTVGEAIVISTCNRTEIYAVQTDKDPAVLLRALCRVKGIVQSEADISYFYAYEDEQAVRHLLRVATGLDSLIVGEKEILGQVKAAVALARDKGMTGRFLNILLNVTVRAGKMARNLTEISRGGVSVSWAAVEMARKSLDGLQDRSVLIVGAGKMSRLAIGDLKRKGADQIYVMNRTRERGEKLAGMFDAQTVPFTDLEHLLSKVDVCICSASAPYYLIDEKTVASAMARRDDTLLLIDLSVPRNIHPKAGDIDRVSLVEVDELDKVVAYNVRKRLDAVYEVERLITAKIQEFYRKVVARSQWEGEERLSETNKNIAYNPL